MIYGFILNNHPKTNAQQRSAAIGRFAKQNGFVIDKYESFAEKPDLLIYKPKDMIVCYAWDCLCSKRSFLREFISYVLKNNIYLYSAINKYCIKPVMNLKAFEYAFEMYEDIRSNFLSNKSLEGVIVRVQNGHEPGRRTGSKNKKHILDGKEKQIKHLYAKGISMNEIAKHMNVSALTIKRFLVSKRKVF